MTKRIPIILAFVCVMAGCTTLNPGADPLVVRTEQAQTVAFSTLNFMLQFDNADRGFWKTNAPAVHNFCEYLRDPVPYKGVPIARALEMQLLVTDLKVAYKQAKTTTNSNALYTALLVLQELSGQAAAWQTIVTSPTRTSTSTR